ncbi:DUF1800 domain-containing protein [Robertkochia aurantiaca]|uniref:DUF1800 domain-containing protein n=1 Tax=Robertkochia aurantiaca TaxID=2873700 RepID=UPI001CCD93D1|nr:DUF1800 domain-containing protein [Robertkochia sp. 3YJGBD-33]
MFETTNCNLSSLAPYQQALTIDDLAHFFRRTGFGDNHNNLQQHLGKNASQLAAEKIQEAISKPLLPEPEWAFWDNTFYPDDNGALKREHYNDFSTTYLNQLISNDLRDRLSFFWFNHFVTEYREYNCPSYLYQYFKTLQTHSLGNFKTFVHEIGLSPAMLVYLNGLQSGKGRPNENYARELYELFTLGEGNGYTEADIQETARALTGYTDRQEGCGAIVFNENSFDTGTKTIFEQTGNWNYDDVIDILFAQKGELIAGFICGKLYEFFVNPTQIPEITNALANTMVSANFELAPVLEQLFASAHFYDPEARGVIIKSHYDIFLGFIRETGFAYDDLTLNDGANICRIIGQDFFNPVDVAGWQRDRKWIGPSTLLGRWKMLEFYLNDRFAADEEQFRTFVVDLMGGYSNNDPDLISRTITDSLLPKGFHSEEDYGITSDIFKSIIQPQYFESGAWNLTWMEVPSQVFMLLQHLIKQPEFQLK